MHYLIFYRIYRVLALIFEKLESSLVSPEWPATIDEMASSKELILQYKLKGHRILRIKERYQVVGYDLHIDYMYMLSFSDGTPIFSCDNAPHHPRVSTFPHHKHRYPKEKFPPTDFSGHLGTFLDDVKWELSR